jgi:type I restriction enzyme M protein
LVARDKSILDLFWLKDERLTELAEEIIDNIEAALASIRTVARALEK